MVEEVRQVDLIDATTDQYAQIGWQCFKNDDFKNMVKYFKQANVDPRLLLLAFEELYITFESALTDHIVPHDMLNKNFKIVDKLGAQNRRHITELFSSMTERFLKDLSRDEDKIAEFTYIDEPIEDNIKDRRPHIKDILPFV